MDTDEKKAGKRKAGNGGTQELDLEIASGGTLKEYKNTSLPTRSIIST